MSIITRSELRCTEEYRRHSSSLLREYSLKSNHFLPFVVEHVRCTGCEVPGIVFARFFIPVLHFRIFSKTNPELIVQIHFDSISRAFPFCSRLPSTEVVRPYLQQPKGCATFIKLTQHHDEPLFPSTLRMRMRQPRTASD